MSMKKGFNLVIFSCLLFNLTTIISCKNNNTTSVTITDSTKKIDSFRKFKPSMMVWNDTGNNTNWSRCWIHHFTYNNTGQLTNIYIRAFDSDTLTSRPDSLLYTLTYDNVYSIYPSEYTFKYYGPSGKLLSNDVHKLISNQQLVYFDNATVGLPFADGDSIIKYQYSYSNGKTIVKRSDFKDSCEYLTTGDKLQQVNGYKLPSYKLDYQFFYTYPTGTTQYVSPLSYIKANKYLSGNGFDGLSKYLPATFTGMYPNSPDYNFKTSYSYITDSLGRVIMGKSTGKRDRTTTVYMY